MNSNVERRDRLRLHQLFNYLIISLGNPLRVTSLIWFLNIQDVVRGQSNHTSKYVIIGPIPISFKVVIAHKIRFDVIFRLGLVTEMVARKYVALMKLVQHSSQGSSHGWYKKMNEQTS